MEDLCSIRFQTKMTLGELYNFCAELPAVGENAILRVSHIKNRLVRN